MIYIGIDLGGTNIAAGAVSEEGRILAQASVPTGAQRPWREVIRDMAEVSLKAVEASGHSLDDVASVGVGVPGYADPDTGVVVFCTNLGWHDVPLREELEGCLHKPVYADNDANVAGFAEARAGVSRGTHSSVFLTLGTGVGGCFIIDGKIWYGAHKVAGEMGHVIYNFDGEPCTCGATGCFERYASATALIRIGKEALARHPDSVLAAKKETLTARDVVDAARTGDAAACEAFDAYTTHLANGISSFINVVDPEIFVLGGGVSKAGAFLLDPVRRKVEESRFYKTLPFPRIELSELGNDAGIIGAALLGTV